MYQQTLHNKDVVVVGLGLTGRSCVQFLLAQGARVSAMDSRATLAVDLPVPFSLGDFDEKQLSRADLVVVSPGVDPKHPAIRHAQAQGVDVVGDVELFARCNQVPVIAITGSNGKSTVTTLVYEMLKVAGKRVLMGGNIGTPVLDLLGQQADMLVLELSSFQLEMLSSLKPLVAVILNLSDDHLDRHGNMAAYRDAKQRIYLGAQHAIYNRDDLNTRPPAGVSVQTFGLSASDTDFGYCDDKREITLHGKPFLAQQDCTLVGKHNMANIQAAAACALVADSTEQAVIQVAKTFKGLAHRVERVPSNDGVLWINDSKATNIGAAIAAIDGLQGSYSGKLFLIAGGDAKGADLLPLKAVLDTRVDRLIALGKDGAAIAALSDNATLVDSLESAVHLARREAHAGDLVLLSPACSSLDMFDNYQQRGQRFSDAVQEVAA